jgi:hypothetical protein
MGFAFFWGSVGVADLCGFVTLPVFGFVAFVSLAVFARGAIMLKCLKVSGRRKGIAKRKRSIN